jgi:hypothetical protein
MKKSVLLMILFSFISVLAFSQSRIPLKTYWHAGRGDNFNTATDRGICDAMASAYSPVGIDCYILATEAGERTRPIKLFWHAGRGDNMTASTDKSIDAADEANYVFQRIEGYVLKNQEPGTVALKLFWSESRQDNFITARVLTNRDLQILNNEGYVLAGIEGYVYPAQ